MASKAAQPAPCAFSFSSAPIHRLAPLSTRPPLLCYSWPSSSLSRRCNHTPSLTLCAASSSSSSALEGGEASKKVFHGKCFVLDDNIDTDQIIPAEYLTLVHSNPEEYAKLGSPALLGLPSRYPRFVAPGQPLSRYAIIIAGANFGCGSSSEHASVALGASGVKAVVVESYARIFFRNLVATGEIYPLESAEGWLCKECKTKDLVTVEMEKERGRLTDHTTGKEYKLKQIGDAGPVIEAGGSLHTLARPV
ncbi:hypothetical protein AMTRI_Chr02g262730 [Amborella trichopoda]